jgi:hypothetical protein
MRRIFLAIGFAAVAIVGSAIAAPNLLDLKVDYTADSVIGSGTDARSGRLWRTPVALRHELNDGSQAQTVIVRLDRNMAWMLMPAVRLVLGTNLDGLTQISGASAVLGAADKLKPVSVGAETIDGRRTTKYRVRMDDPTAGQFDGFVWSTAEGIILKVDGAGEQNGRRGTVRLAFRNVHVGPLDMTLFEPPAGYRQVTVSPAQVATMLKAMEQLQRIPGGIAGEGR